MAYFVILSINLVWIPLMQIIIYLALFLIPFYFLRFSIFGFRTNIFELITLISFLAMSYELRARRLGGQAKSAKLRFASIWPYLFLLAAGTAVFFSEDKVRALGIFKGWFFFPLVLFLVLINSNKQNQLPYLALPLVSSGSLISIWAILQKAGIVGLSFYQKADPASFSQYLNSPIRAFGPFESPNYLAMFLVPTFLLSLLSWQLAKNHNQKTLLLCCFATMVLAIIFSGSSGGFLALVTGVIIIMIGRIKKRRGIGYLVIAPLIMLLLANYLILSGRVLFSSDQARAAIYEQSAKLLSDNYIVGLGLGDFSDQIAAATKNLPAFQEFVLPYALHPHNLFLALWLNLGLFGLIIFLVLIYLFFQKIKAQKALLPLAAAMIAVLAHGIVDTTYFKNDLSALFWLTYSMAFLSRDKNEED